MTTLNLLPTQFPGNTGAAFAPLGLTLVPVGTTLISFQNNGQMALYLWTGTSSTITVTPVVGRQVEGVSSILAGSGALATGTGYWFGPWSLADFISLDGTGNMYLNMGGTMTVTTGATLYQLVPRP
jgi:hypothetical protein